MLIIYQFQIHLTHLYTPFPKFVCENLSSLKSGVVVATVVLGGNGGLVGSNIGLWSF